MVVSPAEKGKMTKAWRRFDAEAQALDARYQEWLERYADQFIAVSGSRVVAASPDLEDLLRALAKKRLPLDRVLIQFMAKEPRRLLL